MSGARGPPVSGPMPKAFPCASPARRDDPSHLLIVCSPVRIKFYFLHLFNRKTTSAKLKLVNRAIDTYIHPGSRVATRKRLKPIGKNLHRTLLISRNLHTHESE